MINLPNADEQLFSAAGIGMNDVTIRMITGGVRVSPDDSDEFWPESGRSEGQTSSMRHADSARKGQRLRGSVDASAKVRRFLVKWLTTLDAFDPGLSVSPLNAAVCQWETRLSTTPAGAVDRPAANLERRDL